MAEGEAGDERYLLNFDLKWLLQGLDGPSILLLGLLQNRLENWSTRYILLFVVTGAGVDQCPRCNPVRGSNKDWTVCVSKRCQICFGMVSTAANNYKY